jgi:hypothetical protein
MTREDLAQVDRDDADRPGEVCLGAAFEILAEGVHPSLLAIG